MTSVASSIASSGVRSSASVVQKLNWEIGTTCLWAFNEPLKSHEPTVTSPTNDGFNPQEAIFVTLAQKLVDVRDIPMPKRERQALPLRLAAVRPVIAEVRAHIEGLKDVAFKTELAPVLAAISAFELSAAEADEFFA